MVGLRWGMVIIQTESLPRCLKYLRMTSQPPSRPPRRRRCGLTLLISIVAFPVHHRLAYSAPRVQNHSTLSTGYLQRREDSATMQNKVPNDSTFDFSQLSNFWPSLMPRDLTLDEASTSLFRQSWHVHRIFIAPSLSPSWVFCAR